MAQWSWRRWNEKIGDPDVESQLHEFGCGAACVVMLLGDRGLQADQLVVCAGLPLPSTGRDLASRLNEFHDGGHWVGGALGSPEQITVDVLRSVGSMASWGALLVPEGQLDGHWVVVDALDDETARVRDPAGSSYSMAVSELLHLLRFMVVVAQVS